MKAQKYETLKSIFEAVSASNQNIFEICTSLIVYFTLAKKKVQNSKWFLPAYLQKSLFLLIDSYDKLQG